MSERKSWGFGPFPRIECGCINVEILRTMTKSRNVLLISTKSLLEKSLVRSITDELGVLELRSIVVSANPTWNEIKGHIAFLGEWRPQVIIGIGGGSVMDTAKILSISGDNSGIRKLDNQSALENARRDVSLVLIPTTAGTGAEMTPFATVWTTSGAGKESVENSEMIPDLVFLDAEFLLELPFELRLFPALDTVSHAVETLWNRYSSPVAVEWAKRSLEISIEVTPLLLEGTATIQDLQEMMLASSYAGMAISESHTAIAHSISYPISSKFGVPHGLACSFTIPAICNQFTNNQWSKLRHPDLVRKGSDMLRKLDLSQFIKEYVSEEDCVGLLPLMNTKSRSDNFIVDAEDVNLHDVIERSFKPIYNNNK